MSNWFIWSNFGLDTPHICPPAAWVLAVDVCLCNCVKYLNECGVNLVVGNIGCSLVECTAAIAVNNIDRLCYNNNNNYYNNIISNNNNNNNNIVVLQLFLFARLLSSSLIIALLLLLLHYCDDWHQGLSTLLQTLS